jgi:hypothetical protein
MWKTRRLTTLWTSMACYRDSFTFFTPLGSHSYPRVRILINVSASPSVPCRKKCARIRVITRMHSHWSCSDVERSRKLQNRCSWGGGDVCWLPLVPHLLSKKLNAGIWCGFETWSHCSLIGLPFNAKRLETVHDQRNWCACALYSVLTVNTDGLDTSADSWVVQYENKKFWGDLIACFFLILHGPHRKRCVQRFYCLHVYSLPR